MQELNQIPQLENILWCSEIQSRHKGMNQQVCYSEIILSFLQIILTVNRGVLEQANKAYFKIETFLTSVARNRLTPIMLDSLLIVSLGFISMRPLQPTTCPKESKASSQSCSVWCWMHKISDISTHHHLPAQGHKHSLPPSRPTTQTLTITLPAQDSSCKSASRLTLESISMIISTPPGPVHACTGHRMLF